MALAVASVLAVTASAGWSAGIVAVGLRLRGRAVPRWLTRTAVIGGLLVLGIGLLGAASGLLRTWEATSAVGLTEADKSRMLSYGYAEAIYNALLGLIGVPAAAAGWLTRERERSGSDA